MSKVTVEQARNMTNQEFFNRVWERAKDPTRAMSGTQGHSDYQCLYRAPNGKECFYGCCIPDVDFVPKMDDKMTLKYISFRITPLVAYGLALSCQRVHDSCAPDEWTNHLREIAREWELTIPA